MAVGTLSTSPDNKKENEVKKETLQLASISPESLLHYLETKAQNHNNFKMYSTFSKLQRQIGEESLFLSTGKNWNDVSDGKSFNPDGANELKFGACFSFVKSESVAMWMLYGGLGRKGAMVDFKRSSLKRVIACDAVELGVWDNGFHREALLDQSQFMFRLIDVLYVAENAEAPNLYEIKRSDERAMVSKEILQDCMCVKKAYPWNYENECRLILTVDTIYVPNQRINSAKIRIPELYEDIQEEKRLYMAPNSIIRPMPEHYRDSTLKAKIEWDLCAKCKFTQNLS